MHRKLVIGLAAAVLVGGVATGLIVREVRSDASQATSASPTTPASPTSTASPTPGESDSPTSGPTTTPSTEPTPAPSGGDRPAAPDLLPPAGLQINTGAVGPVRVGMTPQQAAATGYFDVDVPTQSCGVRALRWKAPYEESLDIAVPLGRDVSSIGITGPGPTTRSGLRVGSTYAQVTAVLGAQATPQQVRQPGQSGLFVNDGDAWIGFLFAAPASGIGASEEVIFIEVTRGSKPSLYRDGC
jgi:hypothetical protein